jgi:hypothetical protein
MGGRFPWTKQLNKNWRTLFVCKIQFLSYYINCNY